ncbi:MAG: PfkB family carbohydrate kinase [Treponemataceae bacterium]
MPTDSFLAVCMNPTLQKTLPFPSVRRDSVNRTTTYSLDASGKGVNVARVLSQLGKRSIHLTQLGGAFRTAFLELCARDSIDIRWAESGSEIRFCYTVIDESDRSVTELVEESTAVAPETEGRILELFDDVISEAGTLIISGTKAAGFSDAVVPTMVFRAKEKGLRVILDVRGKDLSASLPFAPDVIKPNLTEFLSTYLPGSDPHDESPDLKEKIVETAGKIARDAGCLVVLTRGAFSVWTHDGRQFREFPIKVVPPVNTTGSGDAFTAGFASIFVSGGTLADAIAEGSRCGALNAALFRPGIIR